MRKSDGTFAPGKRHSPATEFKPGQTPWNKGRSGYMGANATSFKPGNIPPQQKPPGSVTKHVRRRNGRISHEYSINIDWRGNRKSHNSYKWYLWEVEQQQDRPAGMVLWIKNGNQDDLRPANFEVIDRAELVRRNHGM